METLIQAWYAADKLYFHCSRLEYVNRQEQNVFRVRLLKYRGKPLTLSDGTRFFHNDLLLKIHLHNTQLMKEMLGIRNDIRRAFYVYQRVEKSMPGLAEYVRNHANSEAIKGVLGITLLTRGVKGLGFDVLEIDNSAYRKLKAAYLKPMFAFCHFNQMQTPKQKEWVPKYLVMSKEKLLNHYLAKQENLLPVH